MGIFDALTTAVAGLQAQSFALQNISGNIANSQTTGYKETNTSFEDLVSGGRRGPADVRRRDRRLGRAPTRSQGTIQRRRSRPTWRSTATAISWWRSRPELPTTQPTFSGVDDYTRAGDFQMNSNGYLVNGAGYYLMGIPVDPTTGNPVGSVPQVLQFNNNFVPAQETTQIQYQANLPSTPTSGMLNPDKLRSQSNRRRAGRGADHRHRRDAPTGCAGDRHGHRGSADGEHTLLTRRRDVYGERRHQHDDLHGAGRLPRSAI